MTTANTGSRKENYSFQKPILVKLRKTDYSIFTGSLRKFDFGKESGRGGKTDFPTPHST